MHPFGTLFEFELRQLRNRCVEVARSPIRLLAWLLLPTILVGNLMLARNATATHGQVSALDPFMPKITTYVLAALLAYLGLSALGIPRNTLAFAHPAEAYFAGSLPYRTEVLLAWLELRRSSGMFLAALRSACLAFAALRSGGPTFAALGLLWVAVSFLATVVRMRVALAEAPAARAFRVVGGCLLAAAALAAVQRLPGWGALATAEAHGAWWPTLLVAGTAAAAAFAPSRDVVPELFAATQVGDAAAVRTISRLRLGARAPAKNPIDETNGFLRFGGGWTVLSAHLAAFFRVRTPGRYLRGIALWTAFGASLPFVLRRNPAAEATAVGSAAVLAVSCLAVVAFGSSITLDVRNPLWWCGDASIFARLVADTVGRTWRLLGTALALALGLTVGGRPDLLVVWLVPFACAVVAARCIACPVFAFFSAREDRAGPLALFVPLTVGIGVLSLGAVFAISRLLHVPLLAADALTLAATAAISATCLAIAALRLDGRAR